VVGVLAAGVGVGAGSAFATPQAESIAAHIASFTQFAANFHTFSTP